ncbi:MAG TPA: hypothetical protein VF834_13600 [Streptosporangiaceae bacterium]
MNQLEYKLRAGLRDAAEEIPADSVPPLLLPPSTARLNGGGYGSGYGSADGSTYSLSLAGGPDLTLAGEPRARIRRWLTPAAAAASLLAVAAGTAGVAALVHRDPAASRGAAHVLPGDVPPYYVSLDYVQPYAQVGPTRAEVTATATGAVLRMVSVPRPYVAFADVAGAADDRTFVLRAILHRVPGYLLPASRFFKLTIDPTAPVKAARAHLTALPVPAEPKGTDVQFALSPDGTKLAVLSSNDVGMVPSTHLSVYDLRTGATRTWRSRAGFGASMSWLADNRTLAMTGTPHLAYQWQVLLLDTAAPGASFAADARVVTRISSSPRLIWRQVMITPDGRTLLVARETPIPNGWQITGTARLQRYNVRTGKPTDLVDARKVGLGEFDQVQWSSLSGQVLIALVPRHPRLTGTGLTTNRRAVIFVGNHRYDIPWWRTGIEGAW